MPTFKSTIVYLILTFLLFSNFIVAQNRIQENNSIGWFAYNGTFKVSSKFGLHTEYQWRRDNYITDWQQGLLRLGLNYNHNQNVQFRAGYAWIETFPYGETPLNAMGKDFTEHRIFEAVTIQDKIGSGNLTHRFMLEQRWVGRYSNPNLNSEDEFPLLNRLRYMFKLQVPLKGNSIANKVPYLSVYDEVFIGFGKNVGENVFDQNRIGALLGYKFNSNVQIEGGYLNQILQLGREVDSKNVFQYNHGFLVSLILNVDMTKAEN